MWSGGWGLVAFQVFVEMSWSIGEAGASLDITLHWIISLWHYVDGKSMKCIISVMDIH